MDNLGYSDVDEKTLVGFRKEISASLKFFCRVGRDGTVINILKVYDGSFHHFFLAIGR